MGNMILGAGISGLGAALASNYKYPIYEKSCYAGGLCHSFNVEQFRFDTAVHLSFTQNDFVKSLFAKTPYFQYNPYPINWYKDRWIKHPIQNNLFRLEISERVQAIESFISKSTDSDFNNFKQWTEYQFGSYISQHFSQPYNYKYWCEELEKLGVDWIQNRMYQPTLQEVLIGSMTEETVNTYYAPEMRYPEQGGYQAFIDELIQKADVRLNKQVTEIDVNNHSVTFLDGEKQFYQSLISSIPLNEMIKLATDIPSLVKEAGEKLNHTGVALVSVGINKPLTIDHKWFYIYDEDIMAARVNVPSNKSPKNVPHDCSSLQFEIYYNNKKSLAPDASACVENTLYALNKMGLANKSEVIFADYCVQEYANVIMYPDNKKNAEIIKQYFQSKGIVPIGRFGEWEYLWSDQSFQSGYQGAKSVEDTLR